MPESIDSFKIFYATEKRIVMYTKFDDNTHAKSYERNEQIIAEIISEEEFIAALATYILREI